MTDAADRDDVLAQNNQLMLDATHMVETIDDLREKIEKQAFIGCLHCQNIIYLGGAIGEATIITCGDCHKVTHLELLTPDQLAKLQLLLGTMDKI